MHVMNVNRGSVCKGGHEPQARLAKTTLALGDFRADVAAISET